MSIHQNPFANEWGMPAMPTDAAERMNRALFAGDMKTYEALRAECREVWEGYVQWSDEREAQS